MKIKVNYVFFVIIALLIAGLIGYTIISKQNIHKVKYNLKNGEVLKFDDYQTKVTIIRVNDLCTSSEYCKLSENLEISIKVNYNDEVSYYTLKTKDYEPVKIKNSNNYIILKYEDKKIAIDIKDKKELYEKEEDEEE